MFTPEADARVLEAAADAVDEGLRTLRAHHRDDVWRGALADRFGLGLADQHVRGRAAAAELRRQAAELRGRADQVSLGPLP